MNLSESEVTIDNAAVTGVFTHLFCSQAALDAVSAECGTAGRLRDHVERQVTDLPIVGHPTRLSVQFLRSTCDNTACDTLPAAHAHVDRGSGQDHPSVYPLDLPAVGDRPHERIGGGQGSGT